MDTEILFDITHLRFPGDVVANVNEGQFSLSNIHTVREKFYTDIYKKQYGLSDTYYIPESVFAYSRVKLQETDGKLDAQIKMEFEEIIFEYQQYLETLIVFLWFVKDNSVGLFSTIGIIPAKRLTHRISNTIGTWTCKGEKANIIFNQEEVYQAADLTFKYQKICNRPIKSAREVLFNFELDQHGQPFRTYLQRFANNFDYNNQNCLERALTFLMTARAQSIIIYKIGYYMAAFESLFTTSSFELTTKMSYRIAFYIGQSQEKCKGIAKTIKDAYDIRSKFLHGQLFSSPKDIETERLKGLSENLDDYLRKAMNKIILVDSEKFLEFSTNERDGFLDCLVFDVPFDRSNYSGKKKK